MYVFACRQGHRSNERQENGTCIRCGAPVRLVPFYDTVAPRLLIPRTKLKLDHRRFLDCAPYIDHAHEKAEQEVGQRLARPRWYNAALARARSKAIERQDDKAIGEVSELAKRADRDRPQ